MITKVRNKKLLFVITDYGAFNIFLSELCDFLLNHENYDIYLICSNKKVINIVDKFNLSAQIKIHFVEIPRTFNLLQLVSSALAIRNKIIDISPDLVHCHFTTGIFPSVLFLPRNVSIWGTFHGLGFVQTGGIKKLLFFILEFICFVKLSKIIVINKLDFKAVPFFFKHKLMLSKSLGLGCNLNIYSKESVVDGNMKKALGIQDHFVLAYTGRFVHFKGFHLLLRTFFLLEEKFGDKFKLLLMGGEDLSHKTGLTKKEYVNFLENKNIINLGFVSDVQNYLSLTDLFVFMSKKEGVPISITEALAMCVPVVALDSRGSNDLIVDWQNGFLISEKLSDREIVLSCYSIISRIFLNKDLLEPLKFNMSNNRNKLSRNNFILENSNLYKSELI
jgi:glycosyltransferase involved in cell wall biosynthesis